MTKIEYGMLLEKFILILPPKDHHKSFIKKITNRTIRYHKRNPKAARMAEIRVVKAIHQAEEVFRDNLQTISIGAVCWIIHNKHKEELSGYGFDAVYFDQLNKYFGAQGVALTSAKVVTTIEGFLDGKA